MNAHGWINAVEAGLWFVIGTTLLVRGRQANQAERPISRVASMAFLLFGVSDVIEIFTGAWYEPLGLLAFKAVCLSTLVTCYGWYRRVRQIEEKP